jgi:hypothetical protein
LALLLAQLGAMQHAISHLRADRVDQKGVHTQLCLGCESASSLLSPAGGAGLTHLIQHLTPAASAVFRLASLIDAGAAHFFNSRAPPAK